MGPCGRVNHRTLVAGYQTGRSKGLQVFGLRKYTVQYSENSVQRVTTRRSQRLSQGVQGRSLWILSSIDTNKYPICWKWPSSLDDEQVVLKLDGLTGWYFEWNWTVLRVDALERKWTVLRVDYPLWWKWPSSWTSEVHFHLEAWNELSLTLI